MKTIILTASNGRTWETWINGSHEEITSYYLNKWFKLGSAIDDMQQVIKVEFIK